MIAGILARLIVYCEVVLADRYSKHISTKIMEHASRLDLTSFEDPLFYDKMERARVQGTDRIVMIQSTGLLIQQIVTTISLAGGILFLSPWILAVLVACVIPAFLGETHFAFMGYSLNFRQTPAKREMDYLRIIGGSKESAKELKLFGLARFSGRAVHEAFERTARAERGPGEAADCGLGSLFTLLSALGYYGSYAFVIYKTVDREFGHRHLHLHDRRDRAGEHEHSGGVLDVLHDCRPGDVHHRFAGILRTEADGFSRSRVPWQRRDRFAWDSNFRMCRSPIQARHGWC